LSVLQPETVLLLKRLKLLSHAQTLDEAFDHEHASFILFDDVMNEVGFARAELRVALWQELQESLEEKMGAAEIANEVGFDDNGEYIDSEKLLDFLADEEHSIPLEKLKVISGRADARVYGMKVYGWKAVRGNAVDTWTGTPKDLKIIAEGLLDILYDEGKIDDVNKVDNVVFDIWIHSLGLSKEYTIATLKNGGMEPFAVQQPLLSSQPNKIGINQYNFGANNIAKNQIDDQEKANMNPYYQQKKFPFADWRI
jgi:hypothetical protein